MDQAAIGAIFISYRRDDTEGQAGRLFQDLEDRFGRKSVFMDVTHIEPGQDFRRAIDKHIAECSILLAVIGKDWLSASDKDGRRRLDDPHDFVRFETAAALKRGIAVVPVLVQGAPMPRAEELPPDLGDLAFRNAIELSHARWESDVEVLVRALGKHVDTSPRPDAIVNSPDPAEERPRSTLMVITVVVGAAVAALGVAAALAVHFAKSDEKQDATGSRVEPKTTQQLGGASATPAGLESIGRPGASNDSNTR